MNIQKQGENECMLSTISALSRVPYKDVLEMALEISGAKSWYDVATDNNHMLYWKVVRELKKRCGLLKSKLPVSTKNMNKGNRRKMLPKNKEGSVVSLSQGEESIAHIDPFSNGLVWGTYGEVPLTIEQYRFSLNIKGAKILGIWY